MRSPSRSIVAAVAVFLAAAAPTIASAKVPLRLEWVAPAGCPARADVLADIERTLGTVESSSFVVARIVVAQRGSSFHAEVQLSASGTTTSRTLDGDSCRAVATAAALIVALAINADALPATSSPSTPAETTAPTPPPDPPQPPASPPENKELAPPPAGDQSPAAPPVSARLEPAPAASPPATPSSPHSLRSFFLSGSFVMDTSMLPSAAFGAELSVGWSPAPFDVELRGLFLGPRAATLPANPSQGADLWLTHLGTRACYAAGGTLFRVGPCAGAGFEWTVARGFGPPSDHPADATGEMVVAELGVRATLRLSSRLAARLLAEAVLPFAHPTFVIDGGGDVFHTPVASFRTALGVEAHF